MGHESSTGSRTIRGGGRNVESSSQDRNKMVDRAMQPGGKRRGNSMRMGTQHPHTHYPFSTGKGDQSGVLVHTVKVILLEHGMTVLDRGFGKEI